MTTLDEMQEDYQNGLAGAIHLLIIGETKLGKSDYVAQAAIDGFQVIYVDKDNGFETLMGALKDNPAARKRVHYFEPTSITEFVSEFFESPVVRYNKRTKLKPAYADLPDDGIIEIYPSRIPKGIIFSIDSWTTLTLELIENQAAARKIDLLEVDKYSREIYGGTGFRATQFATMLQNAPFHVILQAHPGYYERKEKPPGTAGAILEKDMLIRDTTQVPVSTSMPHGASMGKYFNQIGWLEVDGAGRRILDFTLRKGRMGAGTPNKKGEVRSEMRFSQLFGAPPEYPPVETWLVNMTSEEMKAKAQGASTLKFAGASSTTPPTTPIEQTAQPAAAAGQLKIPAFLKKG